MKKSSSLYELGLLTWQNCCTGVVLSVVKHWEVQLVLSTFIVELE